MSVLALAWAAISGGFGKLIGLLGRIPWQAYAIAAAVFAAFLWGNHRASQGYDHGVSHERHLWQPTLKALRQEQANNAKLRQAVADQNAATDALKAVGDARVKATQDALRTAKEREKAQAGTIAALDAAGRSTGQKTPCPVSKINKDALDAL